MRIGPQIHSQAGNATPLLACAAAAEAFLAVEIGTMMRIVFLGVEGVFVRVALLGAADCNAKIRNPEVVLDGGVVSRLVSILLATLIFLR